jgi:hypothetical protein
MAHVLVRAAHSGATDGRVSFGDLMTQLGQRSFGWSILLFSVVNLLPLPLGANILTSIPLILLSAQMATGATHLRLPEFVTERPFDRRAFQRTVLRLRPVFRPVERILRPRSLWLFEPESERFVGFVMLAISLALFAPVPFSGWFPAISLLIAGVGLIERDGAVVLIGLGLGLVSIVITLVVATAMLTGVQILAGI